MDKLPESQKLLVILGPTASGKTKLAVEVAREMSGEIISADSRQIYIGMDVGTGKDLAEYKTEAGIVPYHLIDILPAGEKYNLNEFLTDAVNAAFGIFERGNLPIVCGGTGLYIHALLMGYGAVSIPVDDVLRASLDSLSNEELRSIFDNLTPVTDMPFDISTRKRLMRSIEIRTYLEKHPEAMAGIAGQKPREAVVFGLNPPLETRRKRISDRLELRLREGLIEEVEALLRAGLTPEELIYYGLEYKYVTYYLTGELGFDEMKKQLETEIHRFAKRQMTFFRKMEKDGIEMHWVDDQLSLVEKINFIRDTYNTR